MAASFTRIGARRPPPRGRYGEAAYASYQRLVANPFLAAFALVLWVAALKASVEAGRPGWFLVSFLSVAVVPYLFQFHCLDCGATGHVLRSSRHACAHVLDRRREGRPRRFRGPTPVAQTKLWLATLAVAAFFLLASN